jgi:hypothetical protein
MPRCGPGSSSIASLQGFSGSWCMEVGGRLPRYVLQLAREGDIVPVYCIPGVSVASVVCYW